MANQRSPNKILFGAYIHKTLAARIRAIVKLEMRIQNKPVTITDVFTRMLTEQADKQAKPILKR